MHFSRERNEPLSFPFVTAPHFQQACFWAGGVRERGAQTDAAEAPPRSPQDKPQLQRGVPRLTRQFPGEVSCHFGEHVPAELGDVSLRRLLRFLSCLHRGIVWIKGEGLSAPRPVLVQPQPLLPHAATCPHSIASAKSFSSRCHNFQPLAPSWPRLTHQLCSPAPASAHTRLHRQTIPRALTRRRTHTGAHGSAPPPARSCQMAPASGPQPRSPGLQLWTLHPHPVGVPRTGSSLWLAGTPSGATAAAAAAAAMLAPRCFRFGDACACAPEALGSRCTLSAKSCHPSLSNKM